MTRVSENPKSDRQAIALEFLALTRKQVDDARRQRVRYARIARAEGVTNQVIGDALGVSEARVRQLLTDA